LGSRADSKADDCVFNPSQSPVLLVRAMVLHLRAAVSAATACMYLSWNVALAEEATSGPDATSDAAGDIDGTDEWPPMPARKEDRARAMLACRRALWKKWSGGPEEIGALVNQTLEDSRTESNNFTPTLNYTEASQLLAERQLAACSREVTMADLEADKGGSLSEAAVDRLIGGLASGFNLTEEDRELFEKASRSEHVNSEAPSIVGIQVHRVPWWLQILYIVGVVAATCYFVMFVARSLTAREKEKVRQKEEKKEAKKRS